MTRQTSDKAIAPTAPLEVTLSRVGIVKKLGLLIGILLTLLLLADVFINYGVVNRGAFGRFVRGMMNEEWRGALPVWFLHIRRIFNIAREDSIPSWCSSVLTLAVGLVALANYQRARGTTRWQRFGWLFVTLSFCYLALDDAAHIHEKMGSIANAVRKLKAEATGLAPNDALKLHDSYSWQVVMGPLFVLMGLGLLGFLMKELASLKQRAGIVLAFGFLSLAVVLDYFEGLSEDHALRFQETVAAKLDWHIYTIDHFLRVTEELLEMGGMTVFLLLFVDVFLRQLPSLQLKVSRT